MKKLLLLLAVVGMTVACQKEDIPNSEGVEVTPPSWVSASESVKAQPSTSRTASICGPQFLDLVNRTFRADTPGEAEAQRFATDLSDRLCPDEYRVFVYTINSYGPIEQLIAIYDTKTTGNHFSANEAIFAFKVGPNLEIVPDFGHIVLAPFEYEIRAFLHHLNQGNITGNVYENVQFLAAIEELVSYANRGISLSIEEGDNTRSIYLPQGTTNVGVGLRTHDDFYWYGNFDGSLDTILNQSAIDWIEFRYWINGEDTTERFYL